MVAPFGSVCTTPNGVCHMRYTALTELPSSFYPQARTKIEELSLCRANSVLVFHPIQRL